MTWPMMMSPDREPINTFLYIHIHTKLHLVAVGLF